MKRLYLEPSSRCNFACRMCFRQNWFGETESDMPESVFDRVEASFPHLPDLQTVFFGGMGEPLLHPAIADMVRRAGLFANTELITNGSLLSPDLSIALSRAGLSRLWVSVDSFSGRDDQIRRGSRFEKLVENLTFFSHMENRPALGLTFVVMPENLSDLPELNRFADRFDADLINVSHAIPATPIPEAEANAFYDLPIPVGKMRRVGEKVLPKPYDKCPFVEEDAAFVRPDGDVAPCMQLLHNTDTYLWEERRHSTRASFGNVTEQTLDEIWNSQPYADFRDRVRKFEFPCCTICMGCEDRLENRADCMYNTFPTCGACLWSQGKIFCP